ncbi:hypothetical protein SMM_0598 [Spiroplasma mirum ATCC 29335]|nr:hypothetical protein SMM_0598 [Spiroplasma mirum ATCC 29335]
MICDINFVYLLTKNSFHSYFKNIEAQNNNVEKLNEISNEGLTKINEQILAQTTFPGVLL